jgi:phage internal scaffolding protein
MKLDPKAPKVPFMRTSYNYDRHAASIASGLACEDATLAQQHFKDECDINNIVNQFIRTGTQPIPADLSHYGDFSGVNDYHSAMNSIIASEDAFMALPATLRAEFENDPAQLIEFLNNSENYDRAVELGIIAPRVNPTKEAKSEPKNEPKGE